jgi:hypothetical protein
MTLVIEPHRLGRCASGDAASRMVYYDTGMMQYVALSRIKLGNDKFKALFQSKNDKKPKRSDRAMRSQWLPY